MIMTAVAVLLQIEIEVDQGMLVLRADMLQAPEQEGIGIKGIECANRRMEVCKDGNCEDDNDDHIRRAEDLPGMFAVQLQNFAAELGEVFRTGAAVKIEVLQKGTLIEAFEDFIREIVMADGQSMPDNVLNGVDTEISVDSL